MNLKSILSFRSVVPLFAVVSLAAGLMVARELNSFLDIRFASKELPVVPECSGLESSRQTCMGISGTARPERAGDPLPLRIVDEGAIGIRPDPETWGNDYSHNTRAFEHLRLAHPPYVDPAAFAEVEREFHEYVLRMRGMGYNGIVLHGFLDLVDFAYVSGDGVYSEDLSYPA
ncbi:MAG: hypothetical protein HGB17_08535, partial [Syntrophobacteraceae bacterium]|nr:hypothetical protein [Syntrophobacteraceae bacterium]